jgi:outer membrane receptor protein involved in Fe transport
MKHKPQFLSFQRHALATAVVISLALAGAAQAQLSSSTVKGVVNNGQAAAPAGLMVLAVNQASGKSYRTTTLADGSYALTGLAPGAYEIRITAPDGVVKTRVITVQVGETAALNLTLGVDAQLDRVNVAGSAQRQGVKDSQVGTNVSRKMIESLPQATRNFLSSVDLAPGVAFTSDGSGNTGIQAGAQNHNHVNVFIDGIGQKNNIQPGGVSGQNATRGNPFPQSAIAEYKVLTQNYKAEFEQVSSAAITAVTKSGGNEFHGEVYVDRTGTNWRAKNEFEKEREAQGVARPSSSKYEYGLSVGGPIVQNQVHFFFAYDGKDIGDSRQILLNKEALARLTPTAGIVPGLIARQGSQVDNFKEHLLFGKIDAQLNEEQKLTFSTRLRMEDDRVPEDRTLSLPGNDKNRSNDETRIDLKHEWARGPWLSEARAGYEDYHWNPHSATTGAFLKYKVANGTPQVLGSSNDLIFDGGSPDAQDRRQSGFFLSEDLTYTGLAGHVIKGGAKLKAMKYDLSGTGRSVDVVEVLIDRITGLPYYGGGLCTGTGILNGGIQSDQCRIDKAVPGAAANFNNKQFGLFLQDDWSVTKQLEVNLGLRWDYESNMLNNSYATPADRVTALRGMDYERWGMVPPVGQTYAQALAKGGVNIEDFISNGSSRKAFTGAFAPRVGASYDLFADRMSVLFGGWGRSFDRTMANHALDELQKNASPGGEVWLINNGVKTPYSDQFTLGLRQGLGEWNAELALSQVNAKNQFVWYGGNRDPKGGWANQSSIDPLWGGPNGFGTLILGDSVGEAKTRSVLFSAAKPYTDTSGWGVNVAYTYSDAQTTHNEWSNEIFDWTYGRSTHGFNPSKLVEKHRLVLAGVVDKILPWDMALSGKATWTSGMPRSITSCADGWDKCKRVEGDGSSFKQVDLGVSKAFKFGAGNSFNLRADILNLFNTTNYDGLDDWGGGPVAAGQPKNAVGGDNLNLGKPNSVRGDARTLRLMASYQF